MKEEQGFFVRSFISDESFISGFNFQNQNMKNEYMIVGSVKQEDPSMQT